MEQCWSANPENRIQPSLLPKIFKEMLDLCKIIDDKIVILKPSTMEKRKKVETGKLGFSKSENSIFAFTEIF